MISFAGLGNLHGASHGPWVPHQSISPLRAGLGPSWSSQHQAQGGGREKLSEFMSETLRMGLASEDAASEPWDSA